MTLDEAVAKYQGARNVLGLRVQDAGVDDGPLLAALDAAVRDVALAAVGLALRPFNQHGWADIKAEINRKLPEGSGKGEG